MPTKHEMLQLAQLGNAACETRDAEIKRLRSVIINAPCTQHSIPCGWPCGSEIPCWKQLALGFGSKATEIEAEIAAEKGFYNA